MIGIKDKYDNEISEGQTVRVTMRDALKNTVTLCRGTVKYVSDAVSSYGCGYAIVSDNKVTFLSSISSVGTQIEIDKEAGKQ